MQKKFTIFAACFVFIFFNIIFNYRLFYSLFSSNPNDYIAQGESALAEFTVESSYQNLLRFKNPYFVSNSFLYPYSVNLSMNDPGLSNVLFFFPLRPFFDIHSSMLIILLINSFLSNFFMFLLLRRLGVRFSLSLLFSLCFSFTPYISYRLLGHYIYTSLYIFPLTFLAINSFLAAKKRNRKVFSSFVFGAIMGFILMLNLYYFLTVLFLFSFYILYFIIYDKQICIDFIKKTYSYIFFSLLVCLVILSPWIYAVIQLFQLEGISKTSGFGGALVLSADILSFITPSEYNPIYNRLLTVLASLSPLFAKYRNFYLNGWDRFAYPGIIILLGYLIYIRTKNILPFALRKIISPHFWASILFAILLLGPFLKIFNRWMLPLDEGINLVFPLPFLLLHYLPGLSTVRAPTRFLPAFIFLASIVSALLLNYLFTKYSKKRNIFLFFLFIIFFIDQLYVIPSPPKSYLPLTSYQYIKNDKTFFSVLEIPFTVRDGFSYIGFVHAIDPLNGQLIHGKPIIGGYTARVNQGIFNYYKELPFIGYISRIIDKGNYILAKEQPQEVKIVPFISDLNLARAEIDFLDIKYVLLKNNEKYSLLVKQFISDLGFREILQDGGYDLYTRQPNHKNYEEVSFGSPDDFLYTAQGFSIAENGFRWTEGKIVKVFLKTYNTTHSRLIFEISAFYKPQKVKIYVNDNYLEEKMIDTVKKQYITDISGKVKPGMNTITFKFTKNIRPSEISLNEKDSRTLAAQFFSVKLQQSYERNNL